MRQRMDIMAQAVLSALGVWGALACVVTAFAWDLPLGPLAAFCLLFALATAAFRMDAKKYRLYVGCAAVILALAWGRQAGAAAGMRALAHAVTKDYRVCYPQVPLLFSPGSADPMPAMIFLGWLAAALLLLSSLLRRWFWPQVALTLPLLCLPLTVTRVPGTLPLLALGTFWLTCLCTARLQRQAPDRAPALRLYFCVAAVLFLAAVGCLAGEAGKARPPWALQLQRNVLELGEQWSGRAVEAAQPVPAVPSLRREGAVDLSRQGPRSYTGRAMLELETNYQGVLYLRGAVSGAYTGSGWELPEASSGTEALYFPANASQGDIWTARLTPRGDSSGVAYLPQYPWLLEGARMEGDRLALAVQAPYTVTFRPDVDKRRAALHGALAQQELAYAQDLAQWTALPPETRAALRAWAREQGLEAASPALTARRVAAAVRAAAFYDLETPRQPAEEDFALYFLTSSRRGYCVHFATAATVLLRALGVPARYVQGYVLTSGGGVQMVPDSAAHAWTEYYVPGTGWLILDATEGAQVAVEGARAAAEAPDAAQEPTVEKPADRPAPETPTVRFGRFGPESEGAAPQGAWRQTSQTMRALWRRFWPLPAALALAALLGLRRRLTLLLRRRPPKDRNRAVLKSWRRQELLCRGEAPPGPLARHLAEKAKFSSHAITQEELAQMLDMEHRRARLCAQEDGLVRRAIDRWVLCLY